MFIVTKRHTKKNTVDVFDTAAFTMEKDLDFNEITKAKSLGLEVAGGYMNNGLIHNFKPIKSYSRIVNFRPDRFRSTIKGIKVFGMLEIPRDSGIERGTILAKADQYYLYIDEQILNYILHNFGALYYILSMNMILNCLRTTYKSGDLEFLGHTFKFSEYGVDGLTLLWLASIFEAKYGSGLFPVKYTSSLSGLNFGNHRDLTIDLGVLESRVSTFLIDKDVYFTDGDCLVVVEKSLIDSILAVKEKKVLDVKYKMMSKGAGVDMITGDTVVESCESFVINDNVRNYVFDKVHINTLKITVPDARIKFNCRTGITINNLYSVQCKKDLDKLLKKCNVGFIKELSVNSEVFDKNLFDKMAESGYTESIDLLDINTQDEMVNYVESIFKPEDFKTLENSDIIARSMYYKLSLINAVTKFDLLPDEYKKLLDEKEYDCVTIHGYLNKDGASLLKRLHLDSSYAASYLRVKLNINGIYCKVAYRDKIYHDFEMVIREGVSDILGLLGKPYISDFIFYDYQKQKFYVKYQSGDISLEVYNEDDYDKVGRLVSEIKNLKDYFSNSNFTLEYFYNIDNDMKCKLFIGFMRSGDTVYWYGKNEIDKIREKFNSDVLEVNFNFEFDKFNGRTGIDNLETSGIKNYVFTSLVGTSRIDVSQFKNLGFIDISDVEMDDLKSNCQIIFSACNIYAAKFKIICNREQFEYLVDRNSIVKAHKNLFHII